VNNFTSEQKYALTMRGLMYAVECNLATIDDLCMKKSASMRELNRYIVIVQDGIDVFQEVDYLAERQGGRIDKVITQYDRSVMAYAKSLRDRWHPDKPIK
jgi:hypothetical protein